MPEEEIPTKLQPVDKDNCSPQPAWFTWQVGQLLCDHNLSVMWEVFGGLSPATFCLLWAWRTKDLGNRKETIKATMQLVFW